MKKLNKQTRSMLLNAAFIMGTLLIIVFLAVRSGEFVLAWNAMRSVDLRWVGAAIGCFALYAFGEGFLLHVFFLQQKLRIGLSGSLLVGLIGLFYSAITPYATGGQPMQAFALKKRNVPIGVSTSALAVKFFCWQCALLTSGALMWLTHPSLVKMNVNQIVWIVLLGFFINSLTVAGVFLLAINRKIVHAILSFVVRLAHRLRIIKDLERTNSRVDAALEDFHSSVDMLKHHPVRMLVLLFLSFVQVIAYTSIIFCIYRSFGLNSSTFGDLVTLQFILYIGASMTPLPGGSGAQEGGFYLFFQQIFPQGTLLGALLLWRFVTYYLSIIVGFIGVMIDSAHRIRQHRDEQKNAPLKPDTEFSPE
jgi:uncharacterized protein (TIRG00374 family)